MEGNTFRFRISLGYAGNIDLWIEIPMELHERISDSAGKSKMERFEFVFKFADIIKEKFPELDALIHQEIEHWKEEHRYVDIPDNVLHLYGLTSSWFEE
jgi:uncharacterized HAD superfamily protein